MEKHITVTTREATRVSTISNWCRRQGWKVKVEMGKIKHKLYIEVLPWEKVESVCREINVYTMLLPYTDAVVN